FIIGRQGGDVAGADVVSVLLIREEEEGLVAPIVELGNPDRPAQTASKIVLMISGLGSSVQVIGPGIRIQLIVMQNVEPSAMEGIRARLCRETFYASGGSAKFGRHR